MENKDNGGKRRSFLKAASAAAIAAALSIISPSFYKSKENPSAGDSLLKLTSIDKVKDFLKSEIADPNPESQTPELVIASKEIDGQIIVGIAAFKVPPTPGKILWTTVADAKTPYVLYYASTKDNSQSDEKLTILVDKVRSIGSDRKLEFKRGESYNVAIYIQEITPEELVFKDQPILQESFIVN